MNITKPVIALIFPANSHYSRDLTNGIVDYYFEHRNWTIIELPRYLIGASPLPMKNYRLDGAIIWAEPRDAYVNELTAQGIPVINCGMEWRDDPLVMRIHLIQEHLHTTAIQHFTSIGLRRVVAFGHKLPQRPATHDFLNCFATLARSAGLEASVWDIGGEDSPGTSPRRLLEFRDEIELATYIRELPKPIGIYCCGDHMGFLVSEIVNHLGLRIPQDVAIISIGGNTTCVLAHPPLTSLMAPARDIGRAAAEQMQRWLTTGKRPQATISIPGAHLIERESTVGKSGQALLEKVHRMIQEQAIRGIRLEELASATQLSPKTLVRQYEKAFGIHPLAEAHALRIKHAKQLLANEDITIAEVAKRCGFSSQAAFYNYFKLHSGDRPSHWHKTT